MGRKKIKIQPIEGDRNRSATYLKRKYGLFKKAYELAVLTDSEIAVIVFGRNGKLAEFCSGDIDEFLLRYTEYNGTVEKRGPEHFAHDGDVKSDDNDERRAPLEPQSKRERTHHAVLASSRARLDSRRQSQETLVGTEDASPRSLASSAALAMQSGEAYAGLSKRRGFSPVQPLPTNLLNTKETPLLRMPGDWNDLRTGQAPLSSPSFPDMGMRRWSSGMEPELPSHIGTQAPARRLSGTLASAPEIALQDASSRLLHVTAMRQNPSAPPPEPQGLALSMPNQQTSFGLPMNTNFLAPAPSPTTPTTPSNGAPTNMLGMQQPLPSPHDGRILASPLSPVNPTTMDASVQQPMGSPYHNYNLKMSPAIPPAANTALPHDVKRYVPSQGPEIFFSAPEKHPPPDRPVRDTGGGMAHNSHPGMVLPQEPPLSPTANTVPRSMFASE